MLIIKADHMDHPNHLDHLDHSDHQSGRSCAKPQKDLDENFKPEHTLFCLDIKIFAIYALFGRLWVKKGVFFVGKNSVSWARSALFHSIYCILG